ncbi:hypothetical protein HDU84_007544 [Entophlyctis sp. JEL0112]|nr:hypothetical protein HDU84_007544 [Entophlyctis sp. JEL0112]
MPRTKKRRTAPDSVSDASSHWAPGSLEIAVPAGANTAAQLLALAREARGDAAAATDETNADDARAVTQRLYEDAIAAAESAHPALADPATADASVLARVAAADPDTAVAHATSLLELGIFLSVQELLERANRVINALTSLPDDVVNAELLLVGAKAKIALYCMSNSIPMAELVDGPRLGDPDSDDEEESDAETASQNNDDGGEDDADKNQDFGVLQDGLGGFRLDANKHAIRKTDMASFLRNFALLIRRFNKKSPIPLAILTLALGIISLEFDTSAPLIPEQISTDLLNSTKGSCLYHLARLRASGTAADHRGATQDVKECIRALDLVVNNELNQSNEELLGQAYIFLSTVTPKEEVALAAFVKGAKLLRNVLGRSPQRFNLKKQLEELGAALGDDDQDEEGDFVDLDAEIEQDDAYSADGEGDTTEDSDSEGEWETHEDGASNEQ